MSKAAHKTKCSQRQASKAAPTLPVTEFLRQRLINPDQRTHAAYLAGMRARQAAGKLTNPAVTGPLIDRLERAIQ